MKLKKVELLDTILKEEVNQGELFGVSMLVSKDGNVCYRKQFGMADDEKKKAMEESTIFRMYSMTKPVTSVAMMILLERGMIDLLDPVSNYLPGFQNQKVWTGHGEERVNREVTIRDLLSMSAGIVYPDVSNEPGKQMEELFLQVQQKNASGEHIGTVEFCNQMGQIPLLFQPGERWNYSACADICGAIVEVVSKMKFSEFLKKEIFIPLEMKDTGFFVPKEKQDRFAQLYIYSEEEKKNVVCEWRHLALTYCLEAPDFESGGAGLVSTLEDYSHFASMLCEGGTYKGQQILSKKTLDFMTRIQMPANIVANACWDSNRGYGYGNFLRIASEEENLNCLASKGEFGWDGWAGTYFCVQPKDRLFYVFLVQRCGYNAARTMRRIKNVIYSSIESE